MSVRLISRLDIKMSHLIKGVQMEGWRKIGSPIEHAIMYYEQGVDEILYIDVVASLYERNNLHDVLKGVAEHTFVPIAVGGGITDLGAARSLMALGADKLAINTAATKNPRLLNELSDKFGSQAVVLNLECKSLPDGRWTVMTDNGRNHTGRDAVAWAIEAVSHGVGEILISSIDRDGSKKGMDLDLINAISKEVEVPIVVSGGCASFDHARSAIDCGADAIAIGAALHSGELSLVDLRSQLLEDDYVVRPVYGLAS